MQDENDQPGNESKQTAGKSNEHQPTQYTEGIQELAIIVSSDNAGMHRALIHFAAVCIRNPTAQHHRSHRREREQNDKDEKDPIKNPWETLPNR